MRFREPFHALQERKSTRCKGGDPRDPREANLVIQGRQSTCSKGGDPGDSREVIHAPQWRRSTRSKDVICKGAPQRCASVLDCDKFGFRSCVCLVMTMFRLATQCCTTFSTGQVAKDPPTPSTPSSQAPGDGSPTHARLCAHSVPPPTDTCAPVQRKWMAWACVPSAWLLWRHTVCAP